MPLRMHPEYAFAASEDRYRRLVESCPDPILVHSKGRIRFLNAAGVTLLGGSSPDQLVGRPIMDFVHPDFHGIVAERVQKMRETGEPVYLLEEKLLRLDGSVIEVEIAGAHVIYDGEPSIQLVGRDLTHRKRADAERRRLQDRIREATRRESLVAVAEGVAHQLAELSSTIVDTTDQALLHDAGVEGQRALVEIRKAGLRIAALTEQLRAFAGKPIIVRRRIDPSQLVVDISERLETEVRGRANVSYELPGDLPHVAVDPSLMRRVVVDLVRNAVDALGQGSGAIRVRAHVLEADAGALAGVQPPDTLQPGRYVVLEVHDTSLDPLLSTRSPGRGLGLCEVVGLVHAQGGGIQVESVPGSGTSVAVLLPAVSPSWPRREGRGRWRPSIASKR